MCSQIWNECPGMMQRMFVSVSQYTMEFYQLFVAKPNFQLPGLLPAVIIFVYERLLKLVCEEHHFYLTLNYRQRCELISPTARRLWVRVHRSGQIQVFRVTSILLYHEVGK